MFTGRERTEEYQVVSIKIFEALSTELKEIASSFAHTALLTPRNDVVGKSAMTNCAFIGTIKNISPGLWNPSPACIFI